MDDPHWTQVLSALLTPTIAVLVAIIAYRQWRTAQNRLKFDLFDRRFAVYDAARNLLSSVMTRAKRKMTRCLSFSLIRERPSGFLTMK